MIPNTHVAMIATIAQINTNIIGSITFDNLSIVLSNSSLYIVKIFHKEFWRLAVSSPTLIKTTALLGINSDSCLIELKIVSHFCKPANTLSIISWYADILSTSLSVLNVST